MVEIAASGGNVGNGFSVDASAVCRWLCSAAGSCRTSRGWDLMAIGSTRFS